MSALLASIPSPPDGVFHLGPLTLHMYGVMLLLAIAGCVWLTGARWVRWGGDWDLVYRVAIWGVIAGIVGARLYHVVTSWNDTSHEGWYWPFAVWKGGLGIWGGVLFGVAAGAWVVRRSGASIRLFMDATAPGLLLAQAIGRWGNWWNQELFGKPTDLPWAVKIEPEHRPVGYEQYSTFHPTFLYEFTWNVLGVVALLWIDRRFTLRRPALFSLYVVWYTAFRTFEEVLRIDPSNHVLGMRLNFWVSLGCFLAGVAFFVWWQFVRTPAPERPKARKEREVPKGPTMAVPRGRVR